LSKKKRGESGAVFNASTSAVSKASAVREKCAYWERGVEKPGGLMERGFVAGKK